MWFVTVESLFETANRNVLYLLLKANTQIQQQSTKSSSIILALTDGKLTVYINELTQQQVSFAFLTHQTHTLNLFVFILFRYISYPEAIFSPSFFLNCEIPHVLFFFIHEVSLFVSLSPRPTCCASFAWAAGWWSQEIWRSCLLRWCLGLWWAAGKRALVLICSNKTPDKLVAECVQNDYSSVWETLAGWENTVEGKHLNRFYLWEKPC